ASAITRPADDASTTDAPRGSMNHPIVLAAIGWAATHTVMTLLWLWQRRTKNAAGAPSGGGGPGGGPCGVFAARFTGGLPGRRLAIASMMGSWGARLAVHLLYDRVVGKREDGRYAALRAREAGRADTLLFWRFQAMAVAAFVFSLPALFTSNNPAPDFSPLEYA